jgi:hypothetical protein
MSAANIRAARRKIPNPLEAADKVWKAAAGPTNWGPTSVNYDKGQPPIQLAGTRPRKRRGAAGYDKGSMPG